MAYKTDRLVALFPEVYAARDRESLLFKLLDSVGAELMNVDAAVKNLLKSHWVDYATGSGLDGLGAIFGVERRRLVDGSLEPDLAFRLRLKSVVPLFTGGGTRRAVLGAVRSALGLPFDLNQLHLPAGFEAMRQDLENLVRMNEFSPHPERLLEEITNPVEAGQLFLDAPITSVYPEPPLLEWTFTKGAGRRLRFELCDLSHTPTGQGFLAEDGLVASEGETLRVTGLPGGGISAFIGVTDVSSRLHGLGGGPALFPDLPKEGCALHFQAAGALFDSAVFDATDTFNPPLFRVELTWTSHQPLTFDVLVPFFLHQAVADLVQLYKFPGQIFVYEGLDLATIQQVIDQSRAAGVRGNIQFSLNFIDDHLLMEQFQRAGDHQLIEDSAVSEIFSVRSAANLQEDQQLSEHFAVGGVFDFSTFDGPYGFG